MAHDISVGLAPAPGLVAARIDGLLIEQCRLLVELAEAVGTDRPEVTRRRGLPRHQPAQRPETSLYVGLRAGGEAGFDQGLRQTSVIVGEHILEPSPRIDRVRAEHGEQPVGQHAAQMVGCDIAGHRRAIDIEAKEREGPGTGRGEGFHRGQRCREQIGGPTATRVIDIGGCALSQRPQCPAVAVLGAGGLEPPPIVAHEIAKALGVGVPGMLDEGCEARRQLFGQAEFAECAV